jgi:hypothetical protein
MLRDISFLQMGQGAHLESAQLLQTLPNLKAYDLSRIDSQDNDHQHFDPQASAYGRTFKFVDADSLGAEEKSPRPIFNVRWMNQIPSPETVSLLSEPNHMAATITTYPLSSVIYNVNN